MSTVPMLDEMFGDLFGIGVCPEPPDSVPLRLLGLATMPTSHDAVRSAFRAQVKAAHPDAGPDAAQDVQELVWARDVLLRKVPHVTDSSGPRWHLNIRNGLAAPCKACNGERRDPSGEPYYILPPAHGRRLRWVGYCWPCAKDAENERQRQMRADARADRVCPCGQTFTPPRADGRYCSAACRQRAYRRRDRCAGPAARPCQPSRVGGES